MKIARIGAIKNSYRKNKKNVEGTFFSAFSYVNSYAATLNGVETKKSTITWKSIE
jgi:hypothetical protein